MFGLTTSSFTYFLCALFAVQVAAAAVDSPDGKVRLQHRQGTEVTCQEYATLANLSTIGMNSTFRGAFIQSSPDGTLQSSAILDNAMNTFMQLALINDTALNQACGNLSAVAIAAAPQNFSEGVVGPFKIGFGIRNGDGAGLTAVITAAIVGAAVWSL